MILLNPGKHARSYPDARSREIMTKTIAFFERKGKALPVTQNHKDYLPGDVVTWDTNGNDHVGIVTNVWSEETGNYMMVHNIGGGAKVENVLFAWTITGHYRYF